jgi:hypothetical protein
VELGQESRVIELKQGLGLFRRCRPHQVKACARRQQRQRTKRGEALVGGIAVWQLGGDMADQRRLSVIHHLPLHATHLGQAAPAVGQHQQAGGHFVLLAGVAEFGQREARRAFHRMHRGAGQIKFAAGRQGLMQRRAQSGIIDHMAERWKAAFRGLQHSTPEAAALGNMDGFDRRGRCNGAPYPKPLQQDFCALRQGQGARVGGAGKAAIGFQHHHSQAAVFQRQRQRSSRRATTGDKHVNVTGDCHCAISSSISATLLGAPWVSTSQPCSVTTTSSSMRMPIFQNLSDTSSAGRM